MEVSNPWGCLIQGAVLVTIIVVVIVVFLVTVAERSS